MGAPLTIEQIIINHNIGVNISDAETLNGRPASDFSLVGHTHDAGELRTGVLNPARLPSGSVSAKGIVQLSTATDSDSSALAATPSAVKAVMTAANAKADRTHKHSPADINAGEFAAKLIAKSEEALGERVIRNIIVAPTVPPTPVGNNGDIYLQYKE